MRHSGPVSATARLSARLSIWPWRFHAGCRSLNRENACSSLPKHTSLPPPLPRSASLTECPRSLFVCANVITCPQGVPLNITLNSQQHNQLFPLAERLVYLISLLETVISRKAFNTLLILTASGNSIVNQKHGKSNRHT